MIKRISSLTPILVVVSTCFGTQAFAFTSRDELKPAENSSASRNADEVKHEKLRNAFNKLVADAKAGKVAPEPRSQMQPRQSNNLSKGTKIAIGVGIAVAIVATIFVVKADKGPGESIPVF